jgi:predicted DCC family thiol-disulfide oxidoreductase YuxK
MAMIEDHKTETRLEYPVLFFDGYCLICNWFVEYILKKDKKGLIHFSPLQGKHGRSLSLSDNSIIYLRRPDQRYQKSDAALEIALDIFRYKLTFKILKFVPRFLRDGVYNLVAKNRYRFFKKKKTCRIPTIEESHRFLD